MIEEGIRLYDRLKDSWTENEILQLHSQVVDSFMESDDEFGIEAAVEFAKYLKFRGLDNQNYPIFLDLLLHDREEVIYSLLSDGTVFDEFKKLQRTHHLVNVCFELLKRFSPGIVYDMTLETVLNVLRQHFHNAPVGYRLYPLSVDEVNYIAKFLDKSKSQADTINRTILDIFSDLGELSSKDNKDHDIDRIGAQANRVRSAFLDKNAKLDEALPAGMVSSGT